MSDQLTSQSRSNESGITRRTALRGAAWSASAVTVVVATPNIAAASPGRRRRGTRERDDHAEQRQRRCNFTFATDSREHSGSN